ncbi:hypothetical protein CR513_37357, partial [Mucuna pruriens]
MTARTKIDVHVGTLSMEFEDTFVKFNIFEALKHPTEDHSIFSIDTIDGLIEDYFRISIGSANLVNFVDISYKSQQIEAESDFGQPSPQSDRVGQLTPSTKEKVVSPESNTELKPLSEHLKYAYLGDHQQFPVIIANNLSREQEEKLLDVLRRHKKAIGWTLANLPRINPSICMHKILLKEDARPIRQQQRRLNPTILDMVNKEVTKLLVARIIYPISDSQ